MGPNLIIMDGADGASPSKDMRSRTAGNSPSKNSGSGIGRHVVGNLAYSSTPLLMPAYQTDYLVTKRGGKLAIRHLAVHVDSPNTPYLGSALT